MKKGRRSHRQEDKDCGTQSREGRDNVIRSLDICFPIGQSPCEVIAEAQVIAMSKLRLLRSAEGCDHHTKDTMYLDTHLSISRPRRVPLEEDSSWKPQQYIALNQRSIASYLSEILQSIAQSQHLHNQPQPLTHWTYSSYLRPSTVTLAIAKSRRLRCLGHILNLTVKAFLFGEDAKAFEAEALTAFTLQSEINELSLWRKKGPVGCLHNIVYYIKKTVQRLEDFSRLQAESNWDNDHCLQVIVDNATRWNSVYRMIKRAIQLRDSIDLFSLCYSDPIYIKTPL